MHFIHNVVGVCVQSFGNFKLKFEFIAFKIKINHDETEGEKTRKAYNGMAYK